MKENTHKSASIVLTVLIIILIARMLDDISTAPVPVRIPIKIAESAPTAPKPALTEPGITVAEPDKPAEVPEPPHAQEPEPVETIIEEPTPVKEACTIAMLSKENIECWNELFGGRVHFKAVLSYEIIHAGDKKNNIVGVLFTGIGRRTVHSLKTMVVPEGYYEKNGSINDSLQVGSEYNGRVIYGFIAVEDTDSVKNELMLFGQTNMFECGDTYEAQRRSFSDIEGIGRLCAQYIPDNFPILKTQRLLSNKQYQIRFQFTPGAENFGVYDYLFLYENKNLKTIFSAWHDKSGSAMFGKFRSVPKVQYEKDRVVEYSSLHTPFEGRGHEWTFTARSVFDWDGKKFVLKEEQILPLQRDMVDDYQIEKDALSKIQHLLAEEQEEWRLDPLEVARRNCTGCTNYKIALLKQGVGIVWAERAAGGPARTEHSSVYLYGPFYTHEGIANRIVWSVMESDKRIPGRGLHR